MISKYIIRALYKKYSKPPRNFSELNIDEFVSICGDSYGITVDDVSMTFGQMSEDNPFRTICCVIYTVWRNSNITWRWFLHHTFCFLVEKVVM